MQPCPGTKSGTVTSATPADPSPASAPASRASPPNKARTSEVPPASNEDPSASEAQSSENTEAKAKVASPAQKENYEAEVPRRVETPQEDFKITSILKRIRIRESEDYNSFANEEEGYKKFANEVRFGLAHGCSVLLLVVLANADATSQDKKSAVAALARIAGKNDDKVINAITKSLHGDDSGLRYAAIRAFCY